MVNYRAQFSESPWGAGPAGGWRYGRRAHGHASTAFSGGCRCSHLRATSSLNPRDRRTSSARSEPSTRGLPRPGEARRSRRCGL